MSILSWCMNVQEICYYISLFNCLHSFSEIWYINKTGKPFQILMICIK